MTNGHVRIWHVSRLPLGSRGKDRDTTEAYTAHNFVEGSESAADVEENGQLRYHPPGTNIGSLTG